MNQPLRPLRMLLACSMVVAGPALAGDRVNSGNWESVMVTDGESRKIVFCLKPDQAAALNADSKTGRDFAEKKSGGRCTVKDYQATRDTVSYTLSCGTHTLTDVTHYHGDTSDGVKTATEAGKPTITTEVKSRRLGACP
jgi:hypothetical protein